MSAYSTVVQEVRARLPIDRELESRGFKLRPSGRGRFVTFCPFHNDRRRPNLVIFASEEPQRFHCFACGSRGDVVDIVRHLDNHPDFLSALRALADRLDVPWPDRDQMPADREDTSHVLTTAARIYAENLTPEAVRYLEERGLPEGFCRRWKIGYAPQGQTQFLRNRLRDSDIRPDEAIASGLVFQEPGPGGKQIIRDFFALGGGGYITFPNPWRKGRVVDIQGRAFPEERTKPKYLNIQGARRHLFNEIILPQDYVVLTEGIPDALSCLLVGIPSVAIYGTSGFNTAHVPKFSRCRRVYVALDLDATDRNVHVATQFGIKGRVIVLPEKLGEHGDVNDLLTRLRPEEFKRTMLDLMRSAPTGYACFLDRLDVDDPYSIFEAAAPVLAALHYLDPITRDLHLEILARKYGISMHTLRDAAAAAAADSVPENGYTNEEEEGP
jgi:DNA primase catalytic core